jgi:hypothetical protein
LNFYLSFIFFYFFCFISIIGFGFSLKLILFKEHSSSKFHFFNDIGNLGLLGIFFLSFIATVVHFFLPLFQYLNFFIFFIGFIFFIKFLNKINLSKKTILVFLLLFLFSFLMLAYHKPYDDYGLYHLPYMINFTSEKVIFGLFNLQFEQGWNSMWLNFSSLFNLPGLNIVGFNIANLVLFICIVFFFLEIVFENIKKKNYNRLLVFTPLIFLSYFLVKYARLNNFGTDIPSNMLVICAVILMIKLLSFEISDKKNINYYFGLVVIFLSLAATIKLSNAYAGIFLIFLFIVRDKSILVWKSTNIFCLVFILFFCVQQFIYTGCFVFPIPVTCVEGLAWSNINEIKDVFYNSGHVNKLYRYYDGSLSTIDYAQNYNWVKTWFSFSIIELSEHLLTFLLIGLVVFLISCKAKNFDRSAFPRNYLLFFILGSFIPTILWFHMQPTARYGIHYLEIFMLFCAYYIFYNSFSKLSFSKNYIIGVVVICLVFSMQKNILRITKDVKKGYTFFYTFSSIDFKEIYNLSDLKVYQPVKKGKDGYCWDKNFLCTLNNIQIKKTNGYYFIKKTNS